MLVLVAVAALVAWFPGRSEVAGTQVLRAPVSASVGEEGGSWYCAARDMGVADVEFEHEVFVVSLGDAESNLRVEGFSGDQREGSTDITLDAGATAVVNVREAFGSAALSVMVESDRPVSVEHRISFDGGADQSPCSTFSSDTWYFPTAVTTRDATASLNLFNPFPGDASVNIQVALETGVRVPDRLNGLVVPAGSTLVVELGEHVERREQFVIDEIEQRLARDALRVRCPATPLETLGDWRAVAALSDFELAILIVNDLEEEQPGELTDALRIAIHAHVLAHDVLNGFDGGADDHGLGGLLF